MKTPTAARGPRTQCRSTPGAHTPRRLGPILRAALLLALAAPLAACGSGETTFEITESRRVPLPPARKGTPSPHGERPPWRYEQPEGWELLPNRPLRELAFKVAGRDDTLCTFSLLRGGGGGVGPNVNRWRSQMGLEALEPDAIRSLPRRSFLGMSAVFVDLEGDYTGMSEEEAVADARLLGLILDIPQASVFVQLTGPADVVEAERERFDAFTASLAPPETTTARRPPPGEAPPGHPPASPRIRWTAPEGWERQPDKPMREVTLAPPGTEDTECYVTLLGGTGGGLEGNVNRWRGQMGQDPLTDEEIAALPRVEVLGGAGVLVEIEGDFEGGMGAQPIDDAAMLGFVLARETGSVFVKMIGPRAEVLPAREGFEAFCRSLQE